MDPGVGPTQLPASGAADLAGLRALVAELHAENGRLQRLLGLTAVEARPPGPAQTGWFDRAPGPVRADSSPEAKVAFYGALFRARSDIGNPGSARDSSSG